MEARKPILPSRFGENPTVVFWDLDGPFNDIYALSDAIFAYGGGDLQAIENLKEHGFLHQVSKPDGSFDAKNSIYVSNLPLLVATFSILDQNNIMSIMASQRITYGYREEFLVKVLEEIKKGNPFNVEEIEYFPRKDGKVDFDIVEEVLKKSIDDFYNYKKLLPILFAYLKGDKKAKDVLTEINNELGGLNENINKEEDTEKYDDAFSRVLADITKEAQRQKALLENTYIAIDEAIHDRKYFLRETAERLGQAIAMRALATDEDKSCYFILAQAYLPGCNNIGKVVLTDDQEVYRKTFAPHGTFVHADKITKDRKPNLYLAQVLLETIPLKKLLQDLAAFPDQKSANELLRLVVHDLVSKNKFDTTIAKFILQKDLLTAAKLYASYIKQQDLTPDEKKAEFKKFILTMITQLGPNKIEEAVRIADLIKELELPFYNDLLRLETGFHGKAKKAIATLTRTPENSYGITNTWSTVVKAAKQKAESIIQTEIRSTRIGIKITEEQDKNLSLLFAHQAERIAFFKPSNLRNYQELKQDKKLVVEVQRPIIHPVNHG